MCAIDVSQGMMDREEFPKGQSQETKRTMDKGVSQRAEPGFHQGTYSSASEGSLIDFCPARFQPCQRQASLCNFHSSPPSGNFYCGYSGSIPLLYISVFGCLCVGTWELGVVAGKLSASLSVPEPDEASSGLMERTLHHIEILDFELNWAGLYTVHLWKRGASFT